MKDNQVQFAVERVFELQSIQSVVVQGRVHAGTVRKGMRIKVLVDSQLHMVALIKSVEYIDGPEAKTSVGLVLDTPEAEVRELWQTLCQPGDLLSVESAAS